MANNADMTAPVTFPDDGDVASPARAEISRRVSQTLDADPLCARLADERLAIWGKHEFLTAAECDRMVAMIDADCVPSVLFSKGANAYYRTSSSCHLNPWDDLVAKISQRICGLMGIDPATGETIQGQRYQVGQEYRSHCDYFPARAAYWPEMRDSGGQRVWTAMIYLSDVEQGGETEFIQMGFMVPPRKGTILMWSNVRTDGSPNPDSQHAARPVVAGTKYVVTKWFRERRWEPKRS